MSDAELNRVAASRAKQIIVVAEQYKFDSQNTSPFMSIPLDMIDVLITDEPLTSKVAGLFSPQTKIISVLRR